MNIKQGVIVIVIGMTITSSNIAFAGLNGKYCYKGEELVCDGEPNSEGVKACYYGKDYKRIFKINGQLYERYPKGKATDPVGEARLCGFKF